jgi:glycosyltransferase involved in cell wall biosynthesis
MPTIAAVILAKDEEEKLPGCLKCLRFVDEVIVAVDSRSTDQTSAVAEASGARVTTLDFKDFGSAREAARQLTEADWVLSVDADERVLSELAQEICSRVSTASPDTIAIRIPIRNYFYSQEMKHGGWVDETPARLFRQRAVAYEGLVHETTRHVVPGRTDRLTTPLIHFSHRSVEQSLGKDEDSFFTPRLLKAYEAQARRNNRNGTGDSARFVLRAVDAHT